jgi:glycosyltransferase involved in cell wall biosynthesis
MAFKKSKKNLSPVTEDSGDLLMKACTITIVTPSYNQGEFIEETIQSILVQKGDFFIDYIIMDGGSEDESVEIIKEYETLLKENC